MTKKPIIVYLPDEDMIFLQEKTKNGYKASAYLRYLLEIEIEKEKANKSEK